MVISTQTSCEKKNNPSPPFFQHRSDLEIEIPRKLHHGFRRTGYVVHLEELTNEKNDALVWQEVRKLVETARLCPHTSEARSCLEKALKKNVCCPELFFELARTSETPENALRWYKRCMEVIEAIFGEAYMTELLKSFRASPWQQPELILWLKAKTGIAETLFRNGWFENALEIFREIMESDPEDKVCVRYFLLACLIIQRLTEEALQLQRRFLYDTSVNWYYLRAFLRYEEEGDTRRSRRALSRAFQRNLWVSIYLTGYEEISTCGLERWQENSQHFYVGSRQEAIESLPCLAPVFFENGDISRWCWQNLVDYGALKKW